MLSCGIYIVLCLCRGSLETHSFVQKEKLNVIIKIYFSENMAKSNLILNLSASHKRQFQHWQPISQCDCYLHLEVWIERKIQEIIVLINTIRENFYHVQVYGKVKSLSCTYWTWGILLMFCFLDCFRHVNCFMTNTGPHGPGFLCENIETP